MSLLLIFGVVLAVGWITIRSMNREKAAADAVEAIRRRLNETHDLLDLHVSDDQGGFIGLMGDGQALLLVGEQNEAVVPIVDIVAIEGRRDGVLLVRSDTPAPATLPPEPHTVADLPSRIRSLSLRVLVADGQAHEVTFFDGGRHGVPPSNAGFRKAAACTENWYRKLCQALRDRDQP